MDERKILQIRGQSMPQASASSPVNKSSIKTALQHLSTAFIIYYFTAWPQHLSREHLSWFL